MNSNCLEGLRCPTCNQDQELDIQCLAMFSVVDSGTEPKPGGVTWDDDSFAICPECSYHGKLGNFRVENWPINAEHPILCGEWLYYRDPDSTEASSGSSGWYEVIDAPLLIEDAEHDEGVTDAIYGASIISLRNEYGTELQAFAAELSRKAVISNDLIQSPEPRFFHGLLHRPNPLERS